MELTDAGRFLLRKAELILAGVDEATTGLQEYACGSRAYIGLAGLNSVMRVLVPEARRIVVEGLAGLELDVHEVSPADAMEMLYGHRVQIALLDANSIARNTSAFNQISILSDPYVLAVPSGIDLGSVVNPATDLPEAERSILNTCINFDFGSQYSRHVEQWFQNVLPRHTVAAQTRTYEVALAMVKARMGVSLVPALTVAKDESAGHGLTLYAVDHPEREIVALVPSQYLHAQPYAAFLEALQEAARNVKMPAIEAMPPFLDSTNRAA